MLIKVAMKKFILTLTICVFGVSAYAQHSVTTEYRHFDADKDYSNTAVRYEYDSGGHMVFLHYDRTDGRSLYDMNLPSDSSEYDPLQRAALMYMYFGQQHMWGGGVASAADKPFYNSDLVQGFAFYGYCVYSRNLGITKFPLPDGNVFEYQRRARLFVGVGAASDPVVFGQYFLPVFSYVYEGEKWTLALGLPFTAVTYTPSFQHKFSVSYGFQGDADVSYEYKPTPANTIRLSYTRSTDTYKLSDAPTAERGSSAAPEIHFDEHWIHLRYEHTVKMFELSGWVGYMPGGYYFYGKYYRTSSSRKLEETMEYGASVKVNF